MISLLFSLQTWPKPIIVLNCGVSQFLFYSIIFLHRTSNTLHVLSLLISPSVFHQASCLGSSSLSIHLPISLITIHRPSPARVRIISAFVPLTSEMRMKNGCCRAKSTWHENMTRQIELFFFFLKKGVYN